MIFLVWLLYFPALYILQLLQVLPWWNVACQYLDVGVEWVAYYCRCLYPILPQRLGWVTGILDIVLELLNTSVELVLVGGAIAIHAAVFAGVWYLLKFIMRMLNKGKKGVASPLVKKSSSIRCFGLVTAGFTSLYALSEYGFLSRSLNGMLIPICAYIVLAISLNLVVGISGELSLGHAGFMGAGAFTGIVIAALLRDTVENELLRLAISMFGGGIVAGIFGLVIGIPVLRLRGDYLAIVTLAFGEILKNIFGNLYIGKDAKGIQFAFSSEGIQLGEGAKMILKGPQGAVGVQKIATFGAGFVLILFTLFVVLNLINSKEGRAIKAIRDNRIAAESVGINVTAFKLKAFVTSAFLAGMAGALFGLNFTSINASQFNFNTSINILVFVVLGGMGNILGSVVSATVLYVVPELLRFLQDYRMIIYAIVLIVVMLFTWSPKFKQTMEVIGQRVKGKLGALKPKKQTGKEVPGNE